MKYRVPVSCVVETFLLVEADSPEDAADKALEQGVPPGLMFLDHTYPDTGDWWLSHEGITVKPSPIEEYVEPVK